MRIFLLINAWGLTLGFLLALTLHTPQPSSWSTIWWILLALQIVAAIVLGSLSSYIIVLYRRMSVGVDAEVQTES